MLHANAAFKRIKACNIRLNTLAQRVNAPTQRVFAPDKRLNASVQRVFALNKRLNASAQRMFALFQHANTSGKGMKTVFIRSKVFYACLSAPLQEIKSLLKPTHSVSHVISTRSRAILLSPRAIWATP